MAESCTNGNGQGSPLCGLQITCSSEINSNLKKPLDRNCQDNILLSTDSADSGRGSTNSKKMLSSNDYVDNSMDISVMENCNDSHRASDIHKTDTEKLFKKEPTLSVSSQPLGINSSVRPSLSSAFMISSLLSTKTASPFSTTLSQASSSKHSSSLKVTNSTDYFDSESGASTALCINKTLETKRNAIPVSSDSSVNHIVELSKRDSLEVINGQHSDALFESANKDTSMNVSDETFDMESKERSYVCAKSTLEKEDVDMEVESSSTLATENEDCLPVSEDVVGDPAIENKSVASVTEVQTKKTTDGQTVSSVRSDFHNKLDSCNDMFSDDEDSDRLEDHNSIDLDLLLIDESTPPNSADSDLVLNSINAGACEIKITDSVASVEGSSVDSAVHMSSEDSGHESENKKRGSKEENNLVNNVCASKNESCKDSKSDLHNLENNTQNSVVEIDDVDGTENSISQTSSSLKRKSSETKTTESYEENCDIEVTEDNKSLFDSEKKDFQSHNFAASKELLETQSDESNSSIDEPLTSVKNNAEPVVDCQTFEINELSTSSECEEEKIIYVNEESSNLKASKHSRNVDDDLKKDIETNKPKETIAQHNKFKSVDKKVAVGMTVGVRDKDSNINTKKSGKVMVDKPLLKKRNLSSDQEKTRDSDVDDEILFVDETGKSEPVNSRVPKYTFKNILQMPQKKISSNAKKKTAIVDESECLKSTETIIQNELLTTVSDTDEKVGDMQCAESLVPVNQSLIGGVSHIKMESVEDVQNNESVEDVQNNESVSERRRFSQRKDKKVGDKQSSEPRVPVNESLISGVSHIKMESVEDVQNNESISERRRSSQRKDKKVGDMQCAESSQVPVNQSLIGGVSRIKMESVEDVQNNESVNERKRSQKGDSLPTSKRCRLDSMVDKEEKKVKDAATEMSDDMILAEKAVASTVDKDAMKLKDDKSVSLSNEVLQSLITLRVKVFIKNQKQANLDRLNLRTRGMQSASNLWKETAKHLERSVLELSALNQKLESRKAHLTAVKRLASRSIGIQTGVDNVNSPGSTNVPVPPSSSITPAQRTPPVSIPPVVQRTGRPGRPPNSARRPPNIPPTTVQQPAATQPEKVLQPSCSKTPDTPAQSNSVNLIDLTDDEDTSRSIVTKASTPTVSQPVNQTVSRLAFGGKIAASTSGNGYIQQSPLVQGTSGILPGSSNQVIQPSVSGPPLNSPAVDAAGSQHQLVTNSNLAAQHSSSVQTLVPGSRPVAAANTQASQGQSNTSTDSTTLPQNSASAVTAAAASAKTAALSLPPSFLISNNHPAPLPSNMDTGNAPPTAKKRPPKPNLKISRVSQGIVLSWNMPSLSDVEKISSYQLYAYQESESATPRTSLWKKVGEVTALPLPMACTLTQFQEGNKYHFAVRAVDQYGRCGSHSDPSSIYLGPKA